MAEKTEKTAAYTVLSRLHHDKTFYRKGQTVKLSDEHAAPLLKTKVVEPAK
jgi:hypothetical protein